MRWNEMHRWFVHALQRPSRHNFFDGEQYRRPLRIPPILWTIHISTCCKVQLPEFLVAHWPSFFVTFQIAGVLIDIFLLLSITPMLWLVPLSFLQGGCCIFLSISPPGHSDLSTSYDRGPRTCVLCFLSQSGPRLRFESDWSARFRRAAWFFLVSLQGISHWKWKLRLIPRKQRHPPEKPSFQFSPKLKKSTVTTDLVLKRLYNSFRTTPSQTHTVFYLTWPFTTRFRLGLHTTVARQF